jgi:type III secretion system low calcium response chaperone LcrH/SycD
MSDLSANIQQVLGGMNDEQLAEIFNQFLLNGHTVKSLQDLSRDNLEAVYAMAYGDYNNGSYERAAQLFELLCYLDHMEKKYWLGLGAARQMLKNYEGAVDAYSLASVFDLQDPNPPLLAAECHLAMGQREQALSGFQFAVDCAGERPEHEALKQQAAAKLELLQAAGS